MNFIIKNLPIDMHIDDIEKMCSSFGRVMDCAIFMKNNLRQTVAVKMSSNEEAKKGIEGLNGANLEGRILQAEEKKPKSETNKKKKRRGVR